MKKKSLCLLGVALMSLGMTWDSVAETGVDGMGGDHPQGPQSGNYSRPFERPTHLALMPLPPGAIEPGGWLRDWCLTARDGFTGHMDGVDPAFQQAWAADYRMTGENLIWFKGAWPYEGGGYWFDGLARLGFALHDASLMDQARRRLGVVVDHMNTNGIFFLWWLDRANPADQKAVADALGGWPVWTCGLMGRALSGYYAGSGDSRALKALEQAYGADTNALREVRNNLANIWPAYDAYCWSGNPVIGAALDALFRDSLLSTNLSRYQTAPGLELGRTVENAHFVEFVENTTPWIVGYLWTGQRRYLEAVVGWHDFAEQVAMQPYGVPVSDEWYVPMGAFRGSETCDVAGWIWSQICLLEATGQGRMGDRLERAFYNAAPAVVSRDFKSHVYFQSPNRFANLSPDFPHGPQAEGGSYQTKHSPLCCTAALNRMLPWFVTHLWMATPEGGLAAISYAPCKVTALAADHVPVTLECKTDYPFNETVEITVTPGQDATFPIDLRLPGWCSSPSLKVNGDPVSLKMSQGNFARVTRLWKRGDTLELFLPMTPQVVRGRDASSGPPYDGVHRPTAVSIPERGSLRGEPYASVSYGPLLFALPIPDTVDANTPDPNASWHFALNVENPGLTVERSPMPAKWDWPLNSPLKLRARVVQADWNPDPKAPRLPALPVTQAKPPISVTLIPYGCAKFRISMFPVTAGPEVPASAIRRILFLGNSITLHGPNTNLGWAGNWGMAASSEAKDYVHRVAAAIAKNTGTEPKLMVRNIAEFERHYSTYDVEYELADCVAFDPDLVVLAIGENTPALQDETSRAQFKAGVLKILGVALAQRHPRIVVRSTFWPDAAKDQALQEAAQEAGARFVDASSIGKDPANAARSERSFINPDVAAHPGDQGMQALADAILKAALAD
jgi:hypothetical protein